MRISILILVFGLLVTPIGNKYYKAPPPIPSDYEIAIDYLCKKEGLEIPKFKKDYENIPENFRLIVICQSFEESRFKSDTISKTGDYGVSGINLCHKKNLDWENILDPAYNIKVGFSILLDFMEESEGNVALSLKRYNGGYTSFGWEYSKTVMGLVKECEIYIEEYKVTEYKKYRQSLN